MNTKTDNREIFKKIAAENDKQAFTLFFNEYYANMLQFAMLYVSHFEQAEDIVSNVMVRLIKKAKNIAEIQNFESYLFITVKNEALDYLKKEKRRKYVVIDSENDFFLKEYEDPYEKLIEKELRNLIFSTVESLPPKRKMVYKMVKDEHLTYKEVAALLDISQRTVNVHVTMAVKEIKSTVEKYVASKAASPQFMKIAKTILPLLVG